MTSLLANGAVKQHMLDEEYIQTFDNTTLAAEYLLSLDEHRYRMLKSVRTSIGDCYRGRVKSAYGYVWKK